MLNLTWKKVLYEYSLKNQVSPVVFHSVQKEYYENIFIFKSFFQSLGEKMTHKVSITIKKRSLLSI